MTDGPSAAFESRRDRYIEILKPIFLPDDLVSNDIICYFSSLLRVLGMEDGGWDPYAESRSLLNDVNSLFSVSLPEDKFPDPNLTTWRLGLLLYLHIAEMDAPYEVITNLLRFRLGLGYSPNPFFDSLTESQQKSFQKTGISTGRKIEIIKMMSDKSGLSIGKIFDDFYNNRLRNAIAHSDYILTESDFRCRGGLSGLKSFRILYDDLDNILVGTVRIFVCEACSVSPTIG